MEEKSSLSKKYQKIDIDEAPSEEVKPEKANEKKPKKVKEPKPSKEKKAKEPKAPKEKKEKAAKPPKPPKEKKVKEPKPPKPPKEKKVKEPKPPKPPKVKKEKKKWKPDIIVEETELQEATENQEVTENKPEIPAERTVLEPVVEEAIEESVVDNQPTEHISEEIVLPAIKTVQQLSGAPEKKKKEKKPKKEKTPKPPKAPKEKKVKEPKPEKVKKEKAPKPPKAPKEKKPREPLNKKDFVTIGIAVVAIAVAIAFVCVKYLPESQIGVEQTSTTEPTQDKLSTVQIVRDGIAANLVQTDIPDVFYGISTSYALQYYQYRDNEMVPVQATGTVNANVDMGNEVVPVTIEYVELGGQLFGMGLFVANNTEQVYFYDIIAFQLVNLPEKFEQEGKALLLATTSKSALTQKITVWPESFVVDLETGATTRFLKVINRNIDINTGAGVEDFCMLTKDGYSASGPVPFLTSREYESGIGKQDVFVKTGKDEKLYVSDVYGKFLLTDEDSLIYMRRTSKGFNVIRKTGEEEEVVSSFYGTMSANYMYSGDYIFNKTDGKLHNLKTGEEKLIVGYRISPELFSVSPDGKYLVMLGTVTNMMDYQVHIFNLETGEYTKFNDENYSSHTNLTFINNTTAVYMVLDPNQGYEYVVLDVTKTN